MLPMPIDSLGEFLCAWKEIINSWSGIFFKSATECFVQDEWNPVQIANF